MIIDFHSHNFPEAIAPRAMNAMAEMVAPYATPQADGTLRGQLDAMDLAGVDKAVMLPIATKPTQFEVILKTAIAHRDGKVSPRATGRIIPFASVHPADREVARHLEMIAAEGIKGLKFHPCYQNFRLDDPRVFPMFEKIAELGLVVTTHAGLDLGFRGCMDACGPKQIATLMKNVPGLKFVASHLGGCNGYAAHATDELLELGAYIDTSAIHRNWNLDEEQRLLRSWPKDRILFATDFPWVHYPEAIKWVKSIRAEEDWEYVFHLNAERLLGL